MVVRRRSNPNIRFYIAIAIILVLIGALLFVVFYGGSEEITERGVLEFSMDASAVIIRDETAYVASPFTRIKYGAHEGSLVKNGDELATVFRLGYNDELMVALLDDREQVYKEQLKLIGSAKDEKLDEIEAGIVGLQNRVTAAVMGDSGEDLASLQEQLDSALLARREYLLKVQAKEELNALYAKEANQLDIVEKWTEVVKAEGPGRVSYYFDGYEQAINKEKLGLVTSDLLRSALKGSGAASWTTDDGTRVCRIVDPNHWYVAFLTQNEELTRVSFDMEYEVEVKGYGSFKGTALDPVISGNYAINIIEVNDDIGGLIDVRTADVHITSSASGIKVKSDAIKFENGFAYIELVLSESHYRMRVDVLAVNEEYAIVRPHDSGDSLNEGVRYWKAK